MLIGHYRACDSGLAYAAAGIHQRFVVPASAPYLHPHFALRTEGIEAAVDGGSYPSEMAPGCGAGPVSAP